MKNFLIGKFGKDRGSMLYGLTERRFQELSSEAPKKSKQQEKVFRTMLLPRVALYQTLLDQDFTREEALRVLEEHMVLCGAEDLKKKYAAMDKLPFAYSLFRFGFTHIVPGSDLWEADIDTSKKDEFSVTMHWCFWRDTYEEYGCPEICPFACKCDDITYSGLRHIQYFRTQTLGTGGECCDFRFVKKK